MSKYHVTYYYLATGMEGQADTHDYGIIEANSEDEAMDKAVQARWGKEYEKDNKCWRHWGLTATKVG